MKFVTFDYAEIDIEQVKAGYSEGAGAMQMFIILFRDNTQLRLSDVGGGIARDFRRFTRAFEKGKLDDVLAGIVADDQAGQFAARYDAELANLRESMGRIEPLAVSIQAQAERPVTIINQMPKVGAQHTIVFTENGLAVGSETTYEYELEVPPVGAPDGVTVVNQFPRVRREVRTLNRDGEQAVIGSTTRFEYEGA